MSVVAARVYRDGVVAKKFASDALGEVEVGDDEFIWIGLVEPTPEEMSLLEARFSLHPLAVEDALKAHQLPKVDVYGDQLFVVARTIERTDRQVTFGETHIFVGVRHIVTVRHGIKEGYLDLRERLEEAPELLKHGVDYVLHAILDHIVDDYKPVVSEIEHEVFDLEARALESFRERDDIARIFALRRDLMKCTTFLAPMADVAGKLKHSDSPCIDDNVRPYFGDVLDHVRVVMSMAGGLRDLLSSIFEVSALLEQQRLGSTTRKLAAWAALLAVPTAIAGIYGMNFEHMPELKWQYGYPMVLGVIATICGILFIRFKRARWI